ncbi:MAG: flagellar hook-basal body complex protein FliE [Gammaproteobacteria bacterium]|nr:flagellar hook-basal body complex protein FliE [Gammaproteobacteria bacterium]MCP5202294.1 flagellar hook-basal body complex protein FliE [Gammaproteobacteria bacterium]
MAVDAINADAVLARMRALASQAQGVETRAAAPASTTDFTALLRNAIDTVNTNQQRAAELSTRFERGEQGVELADVMISIQKANISFQAATQVRNRLVSAYQDIMNMPL